MRCLHPFRGPVFSLRKCVRKRDVDCHSEPLGRVHPFGGFEGIVGFVQKIDFVVLREEGVNLFDRILNWGSE